MKVTLMALQMKAKHKWTDASFEVITRKGRKLLEKWYGTFRSLLVYSGIS